MHLPPLGQWVDRAAEELLLGLLQVRMLGSGSRKWFVRRKQRKQPDSGARKLVTRKRKKWAARILKRHRATILNQLDVAKVLPHLVYAKVFSPAEYKEILGHESQSKRAELFLEQLSAKGPGAVYAFCSVLEEVCPHMLTCFLLEGDGQTHTFKSEYGSVYIYYCVCVCLCVSARVCVCLCAYIIVYV